MPHTDEINKYNESRDRRINRSEIAPILWVMLGAVLSLIACVIIAAPLWHRMVTP